MSEVFGFLKYYLKEIILVFLNIKILFFWVKFVLLFYFLVYKLVIIVVDSGGNYIRV